MSARTQWFGMDNPPVNPGVYELDTKDGFSEPAFSYWDGKRWGMTYKSPQLRRRKRAP